MTVGIDIVFTNHFLKRVNDSRNEKPITLRDICSLFSKEYKQWGREIFKMGPGSQAVLSDMKTFLNVPFKLEWDPKEKHLDLIAKTIMKKPDFKPYGKMFTVENKNKSIDEIAINAAWKIFEANNKIIDPKVALLTQALYALDDLMNSETNNRELLSNAFTIGRQFNLKAIATTKELAELYNKWKYGESVVDIIDETLKKVNGKWALVSKSNPKKVLQYYKGPKGKKPSKNWVNKAERRVHSFAESADLYIPSKHITLGVARDDMPQVHKNHYDKLFDHLKEHGVAIKTKLIRPHKLQPVQYEFNNDRVYEMLNHEKKDKPIIISSDMCIVDGHHRWLASLNEGRPIKILQASKPIHELLNLLDEFEHTTYKPISESLKSSYDIMPGSTSNSNTFASKAKTADGSDILFIAIKRNDSIHDINKALKDENIDGRIPESLNDVWVVSFTRDGSTDVTGSGDAFRIFATVKEMLILFINTKHPSTIIFDGDKSEGDGRGRISLYSRLAKLISKKFDFTLKIFDLSDMRIFVLDSENSKPEESKLLDRKTLTPHELANLHDVPVKDIINQLRKGIKVELEHTSDKSLAKEIALDHLKELPDYYTKLHKMENN